jgi:protein-disulfide isomerase
MPTILAEYVKTGKVKYVVREFPLESIHPQAFKASEAALCAGDQDQYFEMHERLFADQRALQPSDLIAHAKALGLDETGFKECLDGGKHAPRIRKDLQEGLTAGVSGTPTFFIGLTEPGQSTVKVVQRIVGGQPYQSFKNVIDGLLSQTK